MIDRSKTQATACDASKYSKANSRAKSTVQFVVGTRGLEATDGFLKITEAKQPASSIHDSTRTRILHNRRLAAGQVADCPVADRSVLKFYTDWHN